MTKQSSATTSRLLIIFGAGGHAVSVANVARSAGFECRYFIDKNRKSDQLLGIRIIDSITEAGELQHFCFCIAVGDNRMREMIHQALIAEYSDLYFPPLVHSSATISDGATLGEGTVVMPQAVVGPSSSVGKFCILNTRSSIDHDGIMADFSSLAPGAITGGNVKIGRRTAISIGAMIKHDVTISDDCVIGANSYVNKPITANQVAYGNPAKVIRSREMGDAYL